MGSVLLTWLGHADLRASKGEPGAGLGPIANAVESRGFDHVVLLCDCPKDDRTAYETWLRARARAAVIGREAKLSSPTNYSEIYQAARANVAWVREHYGADAHLTFHLSPGTPPMTVVWILVGTTERVDLIQSSKQAGVETVKVPFEIAAEFVQDYVQRADAGLDKLADGLRPEDPSFADVLHRSPAMKTVVARAKQAAVYSAPVLIEGESGTGKELLAAAIHRASGRKGRFVAINCGAVPKELVESEFFGHKKGSFTGAVEDRKGHFEQARGGTLFLDEIGELPHPAQVKLLRAIQRGEVVRVGESQAIKVDVRIVSATNRSLAAEVSSGAFREDLYYRLAVLSLRLPPLREREGDISLLAERLFERQHHALGLDEKRKKLSPAAMNLLLRHPWPGNVRELEATLLRALVWSSGSKITESEMREAVATGAGADKREVLHQPLGNGFDIEEVIAGVARHYLARALAQCPGNKTKAAALLGLKSQQTMTNWMKRHGVKE